MRELIIVTKPGPEDLTALLREMTPGYEVRPLFVKDDAAQPRSWPASLETTSQFYRVEGEGPALESFLQRLNGTPGVARAYLSPTCSLPLLYDPGKGPQLAKRVPLTSHPHPRRSKSAPFLEPAHSTATQRARATEDTPATESNTRLLTHFQAYLDEPPGGIGARTAAAGREPGWNQPGGRGAKVKVVDLEHAWNLTHEDLQNPPFSILGNALMEDRKDLRDHGTAVAGILVGNNNEFGIVGIVQEAEFQGITTLSAASGSPDIAGAIAAAAAAMDAGDVLLIELEGVETESGRRLPVEFWPHFAAAITAATLAGITVVEAAGNGDANLDLLTPEHDPFSDEAPTGAVLVGAGYSRFTGDEEQGPPAPRDRLPGSNFGSRIDAQGWGDLVVSAGYGWLSGLTEDDAYTNVFNGTSAAAAIVAGAIALIQGRRKAEGLRVLTPAEVRTRLRGSGSAQPEPGRTNEPIGALPDVTDPIWMT